MRTLLFLSLLAASAAFAAAPPAKLSPAALAKLIDQLGSDDEATGKAAEKKLTDQGEGVIPALREAAKKHTDADVRIRATAVVVAIQCALTAEIRSYAGHAGWVFRMVVSPDGKRIVSLGDSLRVWDLESGKELWKTDKSVWSWGLSVSADSKHVLASSRDFSVRLYEMETGKVEQEFEKKHTAEIGVAALSPDGKVAVTGAMDQTLHVWDTATGKLLRSFENVTDLPRCAAFSADGKELAVGHFVGEFQTGTGNLRVWDVATGKVKRSAEKVHAGALTTVSFSPDGKTIVSSSFDKKVKLWDAETLKEKRSITVNDQGCDGTVFTPDGKRLVTAGWGNDHAVKLWDAATGEELRRYEGHTANVMNVAVTSDGKHIVSAGADSVIRLWPLR